MLPKTLQKSGFAGVIVAAGVGPRSAVVSGVAALMTAESIVAAPLGKPMALLAIGETRAAQAAEDSRGLVLATPAPRVRDIGGEEVWQEANIRVELKLSRIARLTIKTKPSKNLLSRMPERHDSF
jgi:hypothetical protein